MRAMLIFFAAALVPMAALGDDDLRPNTARPDYELAREAVERGEILPLATVRDKVLKAYPGTVIEVELEFDDEGVEYELEIAMPDGRILDVDVDAVSGEISSVDEDA